MRQSFPLSLGPATVQSEETIERAAERFFDRLDRFYMDRASGMSPAEYEGYVIEFRRWEADCRELAADIATIERLFARCGVGSQVTL